MTHEDFLNDMYCYYSMNPHMRAVSDNGRNCFYRQNCADGVIKKCAIGRHISDEKYTDAIENSGVDIFPCPLDELAPSLSKLKTSFLRNVQIFHDDSDIWLPHRIDARVRYYHKLLNISKDLDNESTR